jgi:hypothetical protein
MYNTSGATIRGDINIKVEEAAAADKFFIAQRVLPMVLVGLKSGSYPKLTRSATELLTPNSTIRNPKSEYARTQRAWTSDTYDCVDRGLEEPVDDAESQDIGRFFNAEVATARFVLRSMMLDYEIRVQQTLFSTTNFGAATAASVAYTMANIEYDRHELDDSQPPQAIHAAPKLHPRQSPQRFRAQHHRRRHPVRFRG